MLTLKHIIWDGGFETIYQAKEVRAKFYDDPPNSTGHPKKLEFIAFDAPNGDVRTVKFGKVYVMNEAGKTVSSYDMGQGSSSPSMAIPSQSESADA